MKLFTSKQTEAAERSVLDELLRKETLASDALKAKEAQLSKIDREYPEIIASKERELAEVEYRLRIAREKEISDVSALEERRKEALRPIVEEQKMLQKMREETQRMILHLNSEREDVRRERELVGRRLAELEISTRSLEKTQRDVLTMLDRRRQESESSIEAAGVALTQLQSEESRIAVLREEVEKKQHGLEGAEHTAKAAMARADVRIARIEHEQKKVTEQRKMLALAIKELKSRGLWAKARKIINS